MSQPEQAAAAASLPAEAAPAEATVADAAPAPVAAEEAAAENAAEAVPADDADETAAAGVEPAQPAAQPEAAPAQPLRAMPDGFARVLQGAFFEATPLGAASTDAERAAVGPQVAGPADQLVDAAAKRRRRLGRRYARAAKHWRHIAGQQQQSQVWLYNSTLHSSLKTDSTKSAMNAWVGLDS